MAVVACCMFRWIYNTKSNTFYTPPMSFFKSFSSRIMLAVANCNFYVIYTCTVEAKLYYQMLFSSFISWKNQNFSLLQCFFSCISSISNKYNHLSLKINLIIILLYRDRFCKVKYAVVSTWVNWPYCSNPLCSFFQWMNPSL